MTSPLGALAAITLATLDATDRAQVKHPTMKPVEPFEKAMSNGSRVGETCFDPFAGSGAFVIAAENLGRHCFVVEIDACYSDVMIDGFERHTGQTASRVASS